MATASFSLALEGPMDAGVEWIVERLEELQTRLRGIRPTSAAVPVVAAGSVRPRALVALEGGVAGAIRSLTAEAAGQVSTIHRRPPAAWRDLHRANQALASLQLRADGLFRSIDLFNDALATRADAQNGLLLAGADCVVASALARPVPGYAPPLAVTYLDSAGRGGAIARARTALPGGVVLPIAMIRVSPETLPTRLTSLLHEAGHQLNADLGLLSEGTAVIRLAAQGAVRNPASAELWASFASELLADVWGTLLGGVPAVDGLQRVLSLPGALLYWARPGDPHPPGMVRVAFALALTRALYPDPQLDRLARRFAAIYQPTPVPAALRAQTTDLMRAVPAVSAALCQHRFSGLGQRTMASVCDRDLATAAVTRDQIERMVRDTSALARQHPLRGLALLGTARLLNQITPQAHDGLARRWLVELARVRFALARWQ